MRTVSRQYAAVRESVVIGHISKTLTFFLKHFDVPEGSKSYLQISQLGESLPASWLATHLI